MIGEKEYEKRRKTLAKKLKKNSVAVLFSARNKQRSNDTEFPYRQNSNFYYMCGFKEDNAALVIAKTNKKTDYFMFVQKKEPKLELWTGKRLGVDQAKDVFEVDSILSIDMFEEKVTSLLQGKRHLYVDFTMEDARVEKLRTQAKQLESYKNLTPLIGRQRLVKSEAEIQIIKKALQITKEAHHHAMKFAPKLGEERELQADIEYIFKKRGAYSDAYTSIVACGNNANTLHYIKNDQKLVDKKLILIDAGCEYDYYASDITRTIPVNGTFTKAQKELYEMILDVEKKIIKMVRPGLLRSVLQSQSEKLLCEGLVGLGILRGDVKKLLKKKKHKKYYPHGIGHWMGIDVHDESPYKNKKGEEIPLMAGMVMTIEPGIYIELNDKTVAKRFRGIGIRIEDDILVTQEGFENLSKDIFKEVSDIERLSQEG